MNQCNRYEAKMREREKKDGHEKAVTLGSPSAAHLLPG